MMMKQLKPELKRISQVDKGIMVLMPEEALETRMKVKMSLKRNQRLLMNCPKKLSPTLNTQARELKLRSLKILTLLWKSFKITLTQRLKKRK